MASPGVFPATIGSVAYVNGRIYTMNESNPWVSAFIVSRDGIFSHVGSTAEIEAIAGKCHLVTVDLREKFTMPGIHDAHMHLLFSGLGLTSEAVIDMDATHSNIASRIKEGSCVCEYIHVYQDWVLAGAYHNQNFPDGLADRKYLDELYPDTPVVVRGGAAHSMLLNTTALERAGYDLRNEPELHAGKFFKRTDGSLSGELAETAMAKALLAIPFPDRAHVKRALKHAIHLAHRAGVTSTQEASANSYMLQALAEMETEGSLFLDIYAHIVYDCEWLGSESKEALSTLLNTADQYESKHVHTNFVKIMLDGVPIPPLFTSAWLDENGQPDQKYIVTPDVVDAVQRFDQQGRTVKIHCTGHGSTRLALDAIEAARKANPNGPRHEIAHNCGVHEDDYKRYAPLNATAEMSPADLFTQSAPTSPNPMDWNFPKMIQSRAHLTIGSDWGAVPDPSLFNAMAKIVRIVGAGDVATGGQRLCRILTLNGAIAVGREDTLGSVEVGKKANFIVVDRDLSRGEFEGARVLRTYFEGEKVWHDASL